MEVKQHLINHEWEEYYKVLEGIRRTGICNMWGANVYLKEFCPELNEEQAKDILLSWIANYDKLSEIYNW